MNKLFTILLLLLSQSVLAEQVQDYSYITGHTESYPTAVSGKVHQNLALKATYKFDLCNSSRDLIYTIVNSYLKDNEGHIVARQDKLWIGGQSCNHLDTDLYFPHHYDSPGTRQLIAFADVSGLGLRSENTAPINIS